MRPYLTYVYAHATKLQFKVCNPNETVISLYKSGSTNTSDCYTFFDDSFNHVRSNGMGVAIAIK